eukprot:6878910-Prymnesium_polylepis.1
MAAQARARSAARDWEWLEQRSTPHAHRAAWQRARRARTSRCTSREQPSAHAYYKYKISRAAAPRGTRCRACTATLPRRAAPYRAAPCRTAPHTPRRTRTSPRATAGP